MLRTGWIARELAFIRREAVAAITTVYPSREAAIDEIRNTLRVFAGGTARSRCQPGVTALDAVGILIP